MVIKDHDGHDELKHVVFGVDGSEQSLRAIDNACRILDLRERRVKVTVVYVVSLPPVVSMVSPAGILVTVEKNLQMAGETVVAGALKRLADCGIEADVDCHVLNGDAASQLITYAEDNDAQLLVVGAHGHSDLEYFFLGSTADRIVTHAKCSVMISKMSSS
jgi:nucleotide-binding universal stress UspA family protein